MKRFWRELSIIKLAVLFLALGMVSCLDDAPESSEAYYDLGIFHTFNDGFAGWKGGIADIPIDTLDDIEFEFVRDTIDEITSRDNNSIRITSNNPHKDAFVYVAKQLDSLQPNTLYEIGFNVELKVGLEQDTSGQFDPDMYFKVGASQVEPDTLLVENGDLGYKGFALNLDKGNNEDDGSDLKTLDNMEIPGDMDSPYIAAANSQEFVLTITTDSDGKFWMIFGIDSSVPFKMSFYFNSIDIYLKEL